MSDKEILEKAIQKAIDGGWTEGVVKLEQLNGYSVTLEANDDATEQIAQFIFMRMWLKLLQNSIIFNHDFARALWGESPALDFGSGLGEYYRWQFRLMEMAIADDPIKYLGENL